MKAAVIPSDIAKAYERVLKGEVRFRAVIVN